MDKGEHQLGTITYLRIPPELRKRIDALAEAETRTISQQLIVLIRTGLEAHSTDTKTAPKRKAAA